MIFIVSRASNPEANDPPIANATEILLDRWYTNGNQLRVFFVVINSLNELLDLARQTNSRLILNDIPLYPGMGGPGTWSAKAIDPSYQKILEESSSIIIYDDYIE